MLTIKEFTKESIAFKESLIGKPIYSAASASKRALSSAFGFLKKNKPTKKDEKEAIIKLKNSLLGRATIGAGKTISGAASLASRLVTSKTKDGRKLNITKAILIGAPSYAAYKAARRGGAKLRSPKYYGPMKPESVYIDPQRKLY